MRGMGFPVTLSIKAIRLWYLALYRMAQTPLWVTAISVAL
jgi:hypothetical protein